MATQTPEKAGIKPPTGGFQQGAWYSGRQYWGGTLSDPNVIHPSSDQPGAGQSVSKEVVQQTAPGNWDYVQQERKKAGLQPSPEVPEPRSKEEVTPYLNKWNSDIFKSQEAPKVRVDTMEELETKLKPEGGLPPLLKRAEERAKMQEEMGVAGLEASLADIKGQIDEEMATMREQRGIEEGKPVALGVISGRISEEERTAQERVDFLGRQQSRLTDELNTKYTIIGQYMQDIGLDYTDAVQRYDTEFKKNVDMYSIILGQEAAALSQYNKDRTAAQANLTMYANAVTSGNLNLSNASEDQKLMINKLEVQSGLPIGFIGNLQMSTKDRLISVNEKTGEALVVGEDGNLQVIQTGMRATPTGTGTGELSKTQARGVRASAAETLKTVDEGYQTVDGKLEESYKHVQPDKLLSLPEYKEAINELVRKEGISKDEADNYLTDQMQQLGYGKWKW